MPLVNSKEMFEKAYNGGYAIGAFNCNNMEIVQAITEAAKECNSPVILQVSAGARKYAKPIYLKKMVEAAVEDTNMEEHEGMQDIEALIPEAEIVDYVTQLKSITQASGYFNREFVSYEEVPEYLKDKVIKENKISQ